MDFWCLCDELSIKQAALLIADCDPATAQDFVEGWSPDQRPKGYDAAKTAISNALRKEVLEGVLIPIQDYDINGFACGDIEGSVDYDLSRVEVYSLRKWLKQRGFNSGFFADFDDDAPAYLEKQHPRYSPKLAAAISAWLAMDDTSIIAGKSPKQALDKWIRENAAQFGMTDSEGNPVNQAVEDCCKVANWNTTGGAPKTPT